jgi:DNA-binding PadR family transcriptional regulator
MTTAELVILSLIAEKPSHGYAIEQRIETRGLREWSEIGFSSIYYILKKLKAKKLVRSRLKSQAYGPARRVYTITESGRQLLQQQALAALGTPVPGPRPLLLGLSMMPIFEEPQVLQQLSHYFGKLARRQMALKEKQAAQKPPRQHISLMFDYSIAMIEAELAWIARLLDNHETIYGRQEDLREIIHQEIYGDSDD